MAERFLGERREETEKFSLTTFLIERPGKRMWNGEETEKEKSGDTAFCKGPLMIIGDGLGGYDHDREASSIAVHEAKNFLTHRLASLETAPSLTSREVQDLVRGAFLAAATALEGEREKFADKTMNTTLIMSLAFFDKQDRKFKNLAAQVGDGRTYRFRDGEIEIITDDSILGTLALECGMPEIYSSFIDGIDHFSLMQKVDMADLRANIQKESSCQPGILSRDREKFLRRLEEFSIARGGSFDIATDLDRSHQALGAHVQRNLEISSGEPQMRFIDVKPGDVLLGSSDGINKFVNPWEYNKVQKVYTQIRENFSGKEIAKSLSEALVLAVENDYAAQTERSKRIDDISVAAISIHPS